MIERLYVHNFRCLENFMLEFTGHPSVLVIGKNGAGKSTLRHSLALFQNIGRGINRAGKLIASTDFAQHRRELPIRFEVELTLSGRNLKYVLAFEWPENFREARIAEESLSVNGHNIFTRQKAQTQILDGQTFGIDWHLVALPLINTRTDEQTLQEVKAFFASMVLIAPNPAKMTGFSEDASLELMEDAANFASCLKALLKKKPAAYSVFDEHIKAVIPDFSSIENIDRGENGTQLMVRFERAEPLSSLTVEFKALSDGEKCFFLSAYLIALNTSLPPVFCFWDEPDNHLSLSEVGRFIAGLRRETRRHGCFIATTHHPETMRKFSDETTLVLRRRSHLDPTEARPLADFKYTGDLINALLRDEIIG